ncbi:MAG: hypothetical protein M1833_006529 [Piccolia ochrophora]|nr:MAG: hypothetical protein M1833_006529 [Piccolia ochrophora]
MAAPNSIVEPFLRSVLDTSGLTREQCITLLAFAEAHPVFELENLPENVQLQLSRQHKLLFSYLAQLRGLSRDATLRVRQTKQATAEARQEVDRLHLQLQNLYYEQRHLRGEISSCEAYEYQQLPLVPAAEFVTRYPEHTHDNEDQLMIARINHEHAEREALEQARQGLLKKKQGLIADNKKRKDDLANLDKDLETFIDAAKPIQKIFVKEY